jgi:tetratricopeptide (TPR) repeat protein
MIRLTVPSLLLLAAIGVSAFGQIDNNQILYDEIRQLVKDRKCAEALPKTALVPEGDPNYAFTQLYYAYCVLVVKGDTKTGTEAAMNAVRLKPESDLLFHEVEKLLVQMKKFDELIELTSELIAKGKLQSEAYAARSNIKATLGDYKGALDDFIKAAEFDRRGSSFSISGLGNTLTKLAADPQVYDFYIRSFDGVMRASELREAEINKSRDPNIYNSNIHKQSFSELLLYIVRRWIRQAEMDSNSAQLETALDRLVLIPPISNSYQMRSKYFEQKGRLEEAKQDMLQHHSWRVRELTDDIAERKKVIHPYPGAPDELLVTLYLHRGRSQLEIGNLEDAMEDFSEVVKRDPSKEKVVRALLGVAKPKVD